MSCEGREDVWLYECLGFEPRATRSCKQKAFATWEKETMAAGIRDFGVGKCVTSPIFQLYPDICPLTLKIPESVRPLGTVCVVGLVTFLCAASIGLLYCSRFRLRFQVILVSPRSAQAVYRKLPS